MGETIETEETESTVMKKLRKGGAVIIGVVNMHQLGMGTTGCNGSRYEIETLAESLWNCLCIDIMKIEMQYFLEKYSPRVQQKSHLPSAATSLSKTFLTIQNQNEASCVVPQFPHATLPHLHTSKSSSARFF